MAVTVNDNFVEFVNISLMLYCRLYWSFKLCQMLSAENLVKWCKVGIRFFVKFTFMYYRVANFSK